MRSHVIGCTSPSISVDDVHGQHVRLAVAVLAVLEGLDLNGDDPPSGAVGKLEVREGLDFERSFVRAVLLAAVELDPGSHRLACVAADPH